MMSYLQDVIGQGGTRFVGAASQYLILLKYLTLLGGPRT